MEYHPYGNYINTENTWLTKIPSHWKLTTFNRMLKGIKDGTHGTHSRVSDGYPLLSAKNVHDRYLDISDTESSISEEEHKSIVSNGYPAKNDVLITCVGTIGRSFVYDRDEPLSFQRSVAFLRLEDAVFPQYCKYFIESKGYQDYLLSVAKISAQSGVYMGDISKSPILDVPFEEQQKIAAFLDYKTQQIDQLIQKKKALIEKLEEKRIAVITQAVTKGLDKNVKLKPSGVDWLGDVPEHWEVGGLLKFVNNRVDYRGKTPEKVPQGVFLVTAKNIKNGYIDYEASKEYVKEEDYESIMSRGKPEIGDVLFTTEAPLGEVASVDRTDVALAQRIIKFQGEAELNNNFMKYWIMSNPFQNHLQSLATGSTAKGIKASKLFELRVIVPPITEQNEIVCSIEEDIKKIKTIENTIYNAINKLEEYRSALITSAVTGKIDVREVKITKDVA